MIDGATPEDSSEHGAAEKQAKRYEKIQNIIVDETPIRCDGETDVLFLSFIFCLNDLDCFSTESVSFSLSSRLSLAASERASVTSTSLSD